MHALLLLVTPPFKNLQHQKYTEPVPAFPNLCIFAYSEFFTKKCFLFDWEFYRRLQSLDKSAKGSRNAVILILMR